MIGSATRQTKLANNRADRYSLYGFMAVLGLVVVLFVAVGVVPYLGYSSSPGVVRPLDPREWAPYAWTGFGWFLYCTAIMLWLVVSFIAPLLAGIVGVFAWRQWSDIGRGVRGLVVGVALASLASCLFAWTVGRPVLTWLID
jgi:hypothetical protein